MLSKENRLKLLELMEDMEIQKIIEERQKNDTGRLHSLKEIKKKFNLED